MEPILTQTVCVHLVQPIVLRVTAIRLGIVNMVAKTVTGTGIAAGFARQIAPRVIKTRGRVCDAYLRNIMVATAICPVIPTVPMCRVI